MIQFSLKTKLGELVEFQRIQLGNFSNKNLVFSIEDLQI